MPQSLVVSRPGIEDEHSCCIEMANVSRHDVQAMLYGGGGNQPVSSMKLNAATLCDGRKFAPDDGGVTINWEDAIRVGSFDTWKPIPQVSLLVIISQKCDPLTDFSKRDDA
jgi:hypothetical protein